MYVYIYIELPDVASSIPEMAMISCNPTSAGKILTDQALTASILVFDKRNVVGCWCFAMLVQHKRRIHHPQLYQKIRLNMP